MTDYTELVNRLRHYGQVTKRDVDEAADAIEELSKVLDAVSDAHNEGYDVGYWAGRRDYEPKWIPVSERLPDKNMWCLVICNEWGGRITRISPYINDFFGERFEEEGKDITRFVTHWMPLPEPIKGGKR